MLLQHPLPTGFELGNVPSVDHETAHHGEIAVVGISCAFIQKANDRREILRGQGARLSPRSTWEGRLRLRRVGRNSSNNSNCGGALCSSSLARENATNPPVSDQVVVGP